MPTRMERYYRSDSETKRRTSRNEDLYRQIYDSVEYSNIEGVTSIGSTNEIDITKLKELLKSREDYQKEKEYRNIVKREKQIEIPMIEEEEERTYDIRDILSKAKNERTDDDNKDRSLKNTQYNILKNLNLKKETPTYPELEKENQELKELINTITSTSMLNKLNDQELCFDLFGDLKSNNTMVGNTSIQSILESEKEHSKIEDTKTEIDHSFFTSSLGLNEKDFQEYEDFKEAKEKKRMNILIRIFIVLLLLLVIGGIIFLLFHYSSN